MRRCIASVFVLLLGCYGAEEAEVPVLERHDEEPRGAPHGADDAEVLEPADVTRANASEFARQPPRIDWSGGSVSEGERLYMQSCRICHGASGEGEGPVSTMLNPKPRNFREGTFYIDANGNDTTGEPVDLARVILVGAEPFGGSELMQGWHEIYSANEVRHLVAYVRSLDGS